MNKAIMHMSLDDGERYDTYFPNIMEGVKLRIQEATAKGDLKEVAKLEKLYNGLTPEDIVSEEPVTTANGKLISYIVRSRGFAYPDSPYLDKKYSLEEWIVYLGGKVPVLVPGDDPETADYGEINKYFRLCKIPHIYGDKLMIVLDAEAAEQFSVAEGYANCGFKDISIDMTIPIAENEIVRTDDIDEVYGVVTLRADNLSTPGLINVINIEWANKCLALDGNLIRLIPDTDAIRDHTVTELDLDLVVKDSMAFRLQKVNGDNILTIPDGWVFSSPSGLPVTIYPADQGGYYGASVTIPKEEGIGKYNSGEITVIAKNAAGEEVGKFKIKYLINIDPFRLTGTPVVLENGTVEITIVDTYTNNKLEWSKFEGDARCYVYHQNGVVVPVTGRSKVVTEGVMITLDLATNLDKDSPLICLCVIADGARTYRQVRVNGLLPVVKE